MDLLRSMRVFASVVEEGGFAAAARHEKLSKAQVSRMVSGLEDHLGVRLLNRSTRQFSLTDEGQLYLEHARGILEENGRVEADLAEARVTPRGRLKINGPLSWGERFLGDLLPGFLRLYPEIVPDVTLTDRFVDLVDEGYDLAIRIGGNPASALISRKLCGIAHGLYASADYLRRHPHPKSLADMKDHACLAYEQGDILRAWPVFGGRFQPKPVLLSNNGDVLADAAARGMGLTWLPDFIVEDHVDAGHLVLIDTGSAAQATVPVMAVYPERRLLSPRVRVFIDYLAEQLD